MTVDVIQPSQRENWRIDISEFEEGPDTWSQSESEGWKLYLVETIPVRDVYALTRYSWKNNREDELVSIGWISVDSNLSQKSVNELFKENNVTELTDGQFSLLNDAYVKCIEQSVRNTTLDKGFEVFEDNVYIEVDKWKEYLKNKIEGIQSERDRVLENIEVGDKSTYPHYKSKREVENYVSYDELEDEHIKNLDLVKDTVSRPHKGEIKYAEHCQFVGKLKFKTLDNYLIRAIELVHNGVFHNNPATAVVQALVEEGMTQKEIANKLGKDESTVSRQVSVAKNLTERARWHSTNVTTDSM